MIEQRIRFGGRFLVECFDRLGNLKWKEDVHNIVTNEGLNALLNIMLHGSTQITTWYCLLFESDTTPAAGTTYATPVFTESTAYDESTRPAYNEAAASSQSITNSANKAVFTISGTKTMYGAALVGGGSAPSTKGDTAGGGTMFCAAKFSSARSVVDDDVINLTYSISAADDGV
ncbi:MAG: hypothetical protein PHQ43_12435 [Dehalococcoidales bacterium]|nr:hypothetical protein [Dehalococcoidales bacterium]